MIQYLAKGAATDSSELGFYDGPSRLDLRDGIRGLAAVVDAALRPEASVVVYALGTPGFVMSAPAQNAVLILE